MIGMQDQDVAAIAVNSHSALVNRASAVPMLRGAGRQGHVGRQAVIGGQPGRIRVHTAQVHVHPVPAVPRRTR